MSEDTNLSCCHGPLVSIALATYNGARFLREQLDSICDQTWTTMEILVGDDRSTDGTVEILTEYRQKCGLYLEINDETLGVIKNFGRIISRCRGEYIALADQDDVWRPEKIEKIVKILEASPDVGYVFTDAELVGEDLRTLHRFLWETIGFDGNLRAGFFRGEQVRTYLRKQVVTGATMVFRATLLDAVLPLPVSHKWLHDGWIALVASSIGAPGVALAEPLILYRQHEAQQIGAVEDVQLDLPARRLRHDRIRCTNALEFAETAGSYASLVERLRSLPRANEATRSTLLLLDEARRHQLARSRIYKSGILFRSILVMVELISGRYGKFSNSCKSALIDLWG